MYMQGPCRYKPIKITEAQLVQILCQTVGVEQQFVKIQKLHELPQNIKHACLHIGVYTIPVSEMRLGDGKVVIWGYCCACQKLWYYVSSMI